MRRFAWIFCCVATLLLGQQADVTAGAGSCDSGWACNPPWVELANLSFPLRRLNVSSTCGAGAGHTTSYCMPAQDVHTALCETPCDNTTDVLCNAGEHAEDNMLDYSSSYDPNYLTYWQSDNTVDTTTRAAPSEQYIEVSLNRYTA